jgi:signal transduction histidine kinase
MASHVSTPSVESDLSSRVQELERELTEARQQQSATAEILRVVSRSPIHVQPVFDMIAASAARLCGALLTGVYRFDGELIHFVAHNNWTDEGLETVRRAYPRPPSRETQIAKAILDRTVVEVRDFENDPDVPSQSLPLARALGYRSLLAVPMLHEGNPIGAVAVARAEPGQFSADYIELLKTFADQAVIAIENTRLFEEVQARTKELRESLEYQTAISEVLGVISRSPTNPQPVFDAILRSAVHLCHGSIGTAMRFDGERLHLEAHYNHTPESIRVLQAALPAPPDRRLMAGRAILERRAVEVEDALVDPNYSQELAQAGGFRSMLAVPLLRDGAPAGAIVVNRAHPAPFTPRQVALLETFADQAVIALEDARLFEEVQARNRDLTALGEVGRAVSSTLDLKIVLKTIVDRAVDLSGTDAGSIFYFREELGRFELGETSGLDGEVVAKYRKLDIAEGQTGLGDAIANRQPLHVPDVTKRASNPLRDAALEAGLYAALIVPLLSAEGPLGALVLQRRQPGELPQAVVSLMLAFADQSAIALENARLFEEIAHKSRELEIASQHKSQFVANMSHELRTPLAAMLGYAELLRDGMFGELPEKSIRIIERVQANGKHLLGLINTVLDISKMESGQFKLNLGEYSLGSMVETVRVATESLASAKKLSFRTDVVKGLPYGLGDEPRLTQVLLNLVGNAIKFTDAGEVCISAATNNGSFVVSVSDTGPGIPLAERDRIFDKFHQVDSTSTKIKGGTGLGLAIAKEIVEMHGGRIWVESIVGRGATFRMELPVRAQASGAV